MQIRAASYSDLLSQLKAAAPVVAARGKGRTKDQTETWITHRLLPTIASCGLFQFPLEVTRQDRPDLRIEAVGITIGVELTEVVPPSYAQAVAIRNQHYPHATVDRSIFTWGMTFTPAQIHSHLQAAGGKLTGPGWAGNAVEQEWTAAVNDAISSKATKLNKPGFTILQRNWLAIYTSSPGPVLDIDYASRSLCFAQAMSTAIRFEKVFVLTDSKAAVLDRSGVQVHNVVLA